MVAAAGIGAAVAGGVASSATSSLMGGGGGGSVDIPASSPTRGIPSFDLVTPGFGFNPDSKTGNITFDRTDETRRVLANLQQAGITTADQLGALIPQVAPGFGKLTEARVNSIRDAASKSIGDLRENLSRRRVLGSSFAQDTLTRAKNEFGKSEGEARAQSFLEELDLTTKLITQRGAVLADTAEKQLSQLNTEFGIASNLINGTQQVFQDNASTLANLAVANAQGQGAAFQTNFGPAVDAVQSGVTSGVQDALNSLFGNSTQMNAQQRTDFVNSLGIGSF